MSKDCSAVKTTNLNMFASVANEYKSVIIPHHFCVEGMSLNSSIAHRKQSGKYWLKIFCFAQEMLTKYVKDLLFALSV